MKSCWLIVAAVLVLVAAATASRVSFAGRGDLEDRWVGGWDREADRGSRILYFKSRGGWEDGVLRLEVPNSGGGSSPGSQAPCCLLSKGLCTHALSPEHLAT